MKQLLNKTFIVPLFAWIMVLLHHYSNQNLIIFFAVLFLLAAVMESVHHAEIISHTIGEPYGAVVLALAVTVIEVSIIISLMFEGGENQSGLARDTVFSAVMLILNGLIGFSIFIGALKHREQRFSLQGIRSALTVLVAISVLTLIFPNFTQAVSGPFYSKQQLIFVAIVTLILYGSFLFVQNFRHKSDFIHSAQSEEEILHASPDKKIFRWSIILLPVNLVAVVLLAESLAPDLDHFIEYIGAPKALEGVIIASVILLPEALSAFKAARNNQLQQSLNLSIGSALATIGLSIPIVAFVSIASGMPLSLGISSESMVLFMLSLLVLILSLSTGRTSILQGIVLLVILFTYLMIVLIP